MDILCQAKSGMGKTAVFVLATLQQLEPVDGEVRSILVLHPTIIIIDQGKSVARSENHFKN